MNELLTISERTIKSLEFDKIRNMLAELTCCEDAKNAALQLQPSVNLMTVREEVQKTADFYTLVVSYGTPTFYHLKNPIGTVRHAKAGSTLTPGELLRIAEVLRQIRLLDEWVGQNKTMPEGLNPMFSELSPNKYLEQQISSAILSEEEIDDNASPELAAIRRKIKNTQLRVREQLEKIIRSQQYQKYLQEQIITMRDGRFVVPVKAEHRGEIGGLVHDTSSSGSTLFIEPSAVVEANNEIRVLEGKEQDEIQRILQALSAECATFGDSIISSYQLAIILNLYFCKANLAARMNANQPEVTDSGVIRLNKARHPLIDKNKVVPVDIHLGEQFTTLVVTGPNTGGKTVTLKTLGLLTLMTMSGLLIPVGDNSVISIFEEVLVDIGDEQSIEQSLSTFSAHMTNIVSILKQASFRSLVLLDELGSGTDPVEGAALAISVLENLRGRGCRIAASTHYAELKIYALETEKVENACCEFDVATLQPTYRLLVGVPGRSNAFAISSRLGLDEKIIDHAKSLIATDSKRFEDVIDKLEESRQGLEQEKTALSEKNREIEQYKEEIKKLKNSLNSSKERETELARMQARKMLSDIQSRALSLMEELEEIKKSKDKEEFSKLVGAAKSQLKGKLQKLEDAANPVQDQERETYVLPRKLKIGDSVQLIDVGSKGKVISDADKKGRYQIQSGYMKIWVEESNLRLLDNHSGTNKQTVGKATRTVKNKVERDAKTEIDLRGYTVDEALMDLDMFIDNAVMTNVNVISIIHGKGTGVLRTAVQAHLKKHKSIKSFRLGVFGEGESGVTIAELK